jgi:hypothetical protein
MSAAKFTPDSGSAILAEVDFVGGPMTRTISHPANASTRYVQQVCIASRDLAAAIGISPNQLAILRSAGCVPQPTYRVFPNGAVVSAVRIFGEPVGTPTEFYSPAVVWWIRRASTLARSVDSASLSAALKGWLETELSQALQAAASDVAAYSISFAWSHLLDGTQIAKDQVSKEADTIWDDWMNGAWAVCLRRFDGFHLVTKEVERARIASITSGGKRKRLDAEARLQLFDAIGRLDSVMLPFAPHERPHGTPGQFIDAVLELYDLPRSTSGHQIDWQLAC